MLTSVKGSLLEKTFDGKVELNKYDEYIFLDRDPRVFDMVLNHLRNEGRYKPTKVIEDVKVLFDLEIDYWGLRSEATVASRLPQYLVELMRSLPSYDDPDPDVGENECVKKWKELGPISFLDMEIQAGINYDRELLFVDKK